MSSEQTILKIKALIDKHNPQEPYSRNTLLRIKKLIEDQLQHEYQNKRDVI